MNNAAKLIFRQCRFKLKNVKSSSYVLYENDLFQVIRQKNGDLDFHTSWWSQLPYHKMFENNIFPLRCYYNSDHQYYLSSGYVPEHWIRLFLDMINKKKYFQYTKKEIVGVKENIVINNLYDIKATLEILSPQWKTENGYLSPFIWNLGKKIETDSLLCLLPTECKFENQEEGENVIFEPVNRYEGGIRFPALYKASGCFYIQSSIPEDQFFRNCDPVHDNIYTYYRVNSSDFITYENLVFFQQILRKYGIRTYLHYIN